MLDDLADYNRYDCVSTLRLRDWLLGLARARASSPCPSRCIVEAAKAAGKVYEPSPLALHLQAARRPARRPRPRRRPHRARPRRRGDRLPRPRGEELLVVALLPRRAAARVVGGDTATCSWSTPRHPRSSQRWYREDQPARRPATCCELRGALAPGYAVQRGRRAVRALRAARAVPEPFAASPGPARSSRCGCSRCSTTACSSKRPPSTGVDLVTSCRSRSRRAAAARAGRQQGAIDEWAEQLDRGRARALAGEPRRSTCCAASPPRTLERPDGLVPLAPDGRLRRRGRRASLRDLDDSLPRRAGPARHRQDLSSART